MIYLLLTSLLVTYSCDEEVEPSALELAAINFQLNESIGGRILSIEPETIDGVLTNFVKIGVPYDTDITTIPIEVTSEDIDKVTIMPSISEPIDFTEPVKFTVSQKDGGTDYPEVFYVVEVIKDKNTEAILSSLSLNIDGVDYIPSDDTDGTLTYTVPNGTNISNVIPTAVISGDATITPGSGAAITDFVNGEFKEFVVTAQDEVTTKTYQVKIQELEYITLLKTLVINVPGFTYNAHSTNGVDRYVDLPKQDYYSHPMTFIATTIGVGTTTAADDVMIESKEEVNSTAAPIIEYYIRGYLLGTPRKFTLSSESLNINSQECSITFSLINTPLELNAFALSLSPSEIYEGVFTGNNIDITVPYGTNIGSLTSSNNIHPDLGLYETGRSFGGAMVFVEFGYTMDNSFVDGEPKSFTLHDKYDFESSIEYLITVNVEKPILPVMNELTLSGFSERNNSVIGVFTENNIVFTVPHGSGISLSPTFEHLNIVNMDANLTEDGIENPSVITSGDTVVNSFSEGVPKTFTLTSKTDTDNKVQYSITINIGEPATPALTELTLGISGGNNYQGVFTDNNIVFTVPHGTDLSTLLLKTSIEGIYYLFEDAVQGAKLINEPLSSNFIDGTPITFYLSLVSDIMTETQYSITINISDPT
ncbi:MAG: hypothetical protein HRT66_08940 [Flavobacteriaceae bacterium]|nr:hypothetical protein [Flavobacteriaceae bacterium]